MTTQIEIHCDGGVQVLRMSRADKKNALTTDMYKALSDALEDGDGRADVAVHVLFGQPGVFSAGNDLADFLASAKGESDFGNEVIRFVRLLPRVQKPLIAAVDGLAVGIGATLLFHCDLVYATPSSQFSTPFLDLGLVPEAGSSLLMPRCMGYARAFEMLVLGNPVSASAAVTAGFVNAIVAPGQLEAEAMAAARRLAAKPPEALAIARRMMRGDPNQLAARIDAEIAAFSERLRSREARSAFETFFAKHAPRSDASS